MTPAPLDLRDYLAVLRRRKWTIAVVIITSLGASLFFSYRQTPMYTSSSEDLVRPARFDPKQPSAAFGFLNMNTEQQVANSLPVAALANKSLADLHVEPGTVTAAATQEAETIEFTASAPDPAAAQATAQAYAEAYLKFRQDDVLNDLQKVREPLDRQLTEVDKDLRDTERALKKAPDDSALQTQYQALFAQRLATQQKLNDLPSTDDVDVGTLLRPAAFPSSPSSPNHSNAGVLGLMLGLGLGVSIALVRERLDEGVRGRDDLELHSGAPVLAFIPHAPLRNGSLAMLDQPTSAAAEAYKGLRVRVAHAAMLQGFKSIVVTSSLAGEGKTSLTANLGVALAQSGKNVILISADLRRPRLHEYFHPANGAGLTGVLLRKTRFLEALSPTGVDNLWVLHAGPLLDSTDQSDLLGSDSMKQLLAELSPLADFIIIDTPPLLSVSDAAAMSTLTDGVLFVADPRRVQGAILEQARLDLALVGANVIGVIVNNYDPRKFQPYTARYRYAPYGPDPGAPPAGPIAVPASIVRYDASRRGGESESETGNR